MRDRSGRSLWHEAAASGEPRAVLALLVAFGGRCTCARAPMRQHGAPTSDAAGAECGRGRSGCIGDSLGLMASDVAGRGALLEGRARLEAEAVRFLTRTRTLTEL